MSIPLAVIGAPSSAGAYSPGQEKAPEALRSAGLRGFLEARDLTVIDRGDVPGFRWRADAKRPRAMNATLVAEVASALAERVAQSLAEGAAVLVLGGDCSVELGAVSGALRQTGSVGLVYFDLDTDLNTPDSTEDGALDWMGVAHMLGIEGSVPELVNMGPRRPLLGPGQIHFFANNNSTPFERRLIEANGISELGLGIVRADPRAAARTLLDGWVKQFDRLLIHLDVDVLDYLDMPLAENTRRNIGLHFDQLMTALRELLQAPNWAILTVCEVNPDHGEPDGSTLRALDTSLADALGSCPKLLGG
jgi:arginase